ncbi:MAG: YdcF family protein [Anaerolineae bacterium]|nr:YdcF family protein [Anaerolineae bacterium]
MKRKRRIAARLLKIGGALLLLLVAALILPRLYSAVRALGAIRTLADAPALPVAIVFGAQVLGDGRLSAMLSDRVRMGAELYHAGKVRALLLTGDNHIATYNEPEAMRRYALSLGVPEDAVVLDYAGFRTYDSCYRARDIFQVEAAILVTQRFHLDRALMICNALGVDSVGVAADVLRPQGYSRRAVLSSEIREFPSTALSLFDLLRGDLPTYLGDPLPIFVDSSCAEGCGVDVWRIW